MPDVDKQLDDLRLPSWMNRGEPARLLRAARSFWRWVHGWLVWPLRQLDATTCTVPLLHVLAYQRDIARFNGEPLALFRKRVQYAFINARDAGSVAGFIAIFERLGVGYVEILERQPGIDWDVISVRVTDGQVAGNPELLMQIIQQYGRTCRRYRFDVINHSALPLRAGGVECEYMCYSASMSSASLKE